MNLPGTRRIHGACRTATLLTVLALSISTASAEALFGQTDDNFNGRVMSGSVVPGGEATIRGFAFKPGQEVTLLRSQTVLNPQAPFVADAEGRFEGSIRIPANAVPGHHPVLVDVAGPAAATTLQLKISPDVPLSGEKNFNVTNQKLAPGLFQVAYSAKNKRLFVSASEGRPPVKESQLLKIKPDDLSIEARSTPATAPWRDDGHLAAVYGIAVDDAKGTVWTTNTRDNTVSVYKQDDLSLLKLFERNTVPHAFHVAVDAKHGKAFASTATQNFVVAFDTATLETTGRIEIESSIRPAGRGPAPTFGAMGLAVDEQAGKLYVISGSTGEVAIIDTTSQAVEAVFRVPGMRSGFGASVDPKGKRLYVSDQGADSLFIIDLASQELLHQVPVGAGALGVGFDPVSGYAYVGSRGAGTITVVSPDGKIIANLAGGTQPNHVSVGAKGAVFMVSKSRGADDPTGDLITRVNARK